MAKVGENVVFVKATVESYADLKASDGTKYTVYNINVTDSSDRVHVLQKRFNEFHGLYQQLRGQHPEVAQFKFPAKTTLNFNKHEARVKETRCDRFNEFVKVVMKLQPMPSQVRAWLEQESHKDSSIFRDLAVTRAYKDRPMVVPAADDKTLILEMMMKPTPFLKYGRQGAPHWRLFYLTPDRQRIVWSSRKLMGPGASQVNVAAIKYVQNTQRSKVFERHAARIKELANVSMSIVYTVPGTTQQRTLDVVCKHPEVLRTWLLGIEMLISDLDKQGGYQGAADAGAAATPEGDEDEDEEAEDTNLITAGCSVYSWGTGGWGQLAQTDDLPTSEGRNVVAPMLKVTQKKTNQKLDIRAAACGGSQTIVIDRRIGAFACGRASLCAEAVGGSMRDHILTMQPVQIPTLDTRVSPMEMPTPVMELAQVACGESHTILLTFTGHVLVFGSNFFGQLGDGTTVDRGEATPIQGPWSKSSDARVMMVSAGQSCSAAVTWSSAGTTLYTWGCGEFGILGHGDATDKLTPTAVEGVSQYLQTSKNAMSITQVECGGWHMAVLLTESGVSTSSVSADSPTSSAAVAATVDDRTLLLTWGSSSCGQLGHGGFTDQATPLHIEMLTGGKEVVQVACGASHTAAILNITSGGRRIKGQLWTWGNGTPSTGQSEAAHSAIPRYYNFTKRDANQNNVAVQISCGDNFTAVLDEDAKVTVIGVSPLTGEACRQDLTIPKEDESRTNLDVETVTAGGTHVCLVLAERIAR